MIRRYALVALLSAACSGCGNGSHTVPAGAPLAPASASKLALAVPAPPHNVSVPPRSDVLRTTPKSPDRSARRSTRSTGHPAFFNGEAALGNGVYYLQFPNGNVFGYYSYLSDPHYIYHFDLGYEYVSDPADGKGGVYLYDFASTDWWYTTPSFPFPYVYDFALNAFVYYYPDTKNAGHYTASPRYFYDFPDGQIITLPGPQMNPSALSFGGGTNLTQRFGVTESGVAAAANVDASGCSGIATASAVNSYTYTVTPGQPGTCSLIVNDSKGLRSALPILVSNSPTGSVTEFPVTPGSSPIQVTSGPDGNLWFTEDFSHKVARMTTAGTGYTEFTPPTASSLPLGITPGTDGNLWFTEYEGNQIARITPTGTVTEFPLPRPSPKVFPESLVQGPDGAFWFTEEPATNSAVGKMTTAGVVTEYFTPTTNSGPSEITVGPDHNLWFTEDNGNRVARMTTAGVITEFAVPTAGGDPSGIAAGPDGALWFTETWGNKIGRVTVGGAFTEYSLPTFNAFPFDITAGPDGNLWFTELNGNHVGRISTSGAIAEFPIPTASAGLRGITVGPDNQIWFMESAANNVGRIHP